MSDLFNPEISWLEQLPSNLRPDDDKVEKLENLRSHYFLPNDIFVGIILSSPAITRQVQKNVYELGSIEGQVLQYNKKCMDVARLFF